MNKDQFRQKINDHYKAAMQDCQLPTGALAELSPSEYYAWCKEREVEWILSRACVGSSEQDGSGDSDASNLGGDDFWIERKEYILNDPMFNRYYALYRNGVNLDELKNEMITHLLKIKKELTESLIDATERAMPRNWVGKI